MRSCIAKASFLLLFVFRFVIAIGQTGYVNPVIPGFYPDPSVCRAGDNYYLVNSSFEYFPGIPVWHSKDLVHWQQIGHVLDRPTQLPLFQCKPSNGIYAPTVRYHDGTFYVIVTNVTGNREYNNFYVTAPRPEGPWSEPIRVAQNGIDPSLFFDTDGRAYLQTNRAHAPTDPRAIYQSEIDIRTGALLSDIKEIWKGSGGSYVESPHVYKKDGYYYLMTAEGGTAYGHTVAIGRSKNIWGPFESCPNNPILTNRMAYGNIQGTGHADLVQATDSSWWMVHLAFRPAVDGIHFIGRETCLSPVVWETGKWPVVNGTGQAFEKNAHAPAGTPDVVSPFDLPKAFDFEAPRLDPSFVYLRNPIESAYSLSERKGFLRLRGTADNLNGLGSPAFVARRQQHFDFSAETSLDFSPTAENEEAGVTLLMTNRFHYDFSVRKKGKDKVLCVRYVLDSLDQVLKETVIKDGPIKLTVSGSKTLYRFAFSQGKTSVDLGSLNTRFLGTEVTGGYNGVLIGLFATGNGTDCKANAYFDHFNYSPRP